MTSTTGEGRAISRRHAISMLGMLAGGLATGTVAACSGPGTGDGIATPATEQAVSPPSSTAPRPPRPDRIVSMWMFDWQPPTIDELPADVLDTLSMLVVAMAQSARSGSGLLHFRPNRTTAEEMASHIDTVVRSGRPVLIGIGGQNDGGITVTNDTQVEEFCDSVRQLVTNYGFTGIDLDLEPSGSTWTQEALVAAVRRLKSEFGPDFLVGITAALYGEHTARWLTLADALADSYDFFAHMLYDYVEATDGRLEQDALRKVGIAVAGGIPAAKQVLGFMCNTSTYSSPVTLTGSTWSTTVARYPDLLGAFIWESSIEARVDYEWTRSVGAAIADR